jgi:hypothetical protein
MRASGDSNVNNNEDGPEGGQEPDVFASKHPAVGVGSELDLLEEKELSQGQEHVNSLPQVNQEFFYEGLHLQRVPAAQRCRN